MSQPSLSELIDLKNKTAIVTGGAMGIGLGIVRRLYEAGANVVIADIDIKAAQAAAANIGTNTLPVVVDVARESDVDNLVKQAVAKFGGIDILVNNAGIYPNEPVMKMSVKDFDKVIAVNLRGAYLCTKKVAEVLVKQGRGGRIVNITSIDALHPSMAGLAHYDASKHGLWGFTKNIALELAPYKIWVNAVAPGAIATPGVQKLQSKTVPAGVDMEKVLAGFLAKIPMGRMGDPDDIGRSVLFLSSDLSSYITGTQLVVDGGVLLS